MNIQFIPVTLLQLLFLKCRTLHSIYTLNFIQCLFNKALKKNWTDKRKKKLVKEATLSFFYFQYSFIVLF